jgi:hypothetical protein
MGSSVNVPVRFSSFPEHVCPTSSFLVVALFRRSFDCSTQYNLLHTVETASLLLKLDQRTKEVASYFV